MTKKLPIILACVFAPVFAVAQNNDDAEYAYMHPKLFQARLFAGFNFCQVVGDDYAGYHKVGINAGGMVYVHLRPALGASMEILYSQKGARGANVEQSYTVGTYFNKYYLNLDYVEIAPMLHLDMFIFDYEAGFSFAELVKSEEWADADVPVVFPPSLTYFNSYDADWVAGATMRINNRWSLNGRYQYSLTPIRPWSREQPAYSNGSANEYNEVVTLRLVYKIQ